MEAIAGLSLAANILQLVDFTAKVLSTGNQIRMSGSTAQNSELELVARDFTALNERITLWARPNPASSDPLAKDSQVRGVLVWVYAPATIFLQVCRHSRIWLQSARALPKNLLLYLSRCDVPEVRPDTKRFSAPFEQLGARKRLRIPSLDFKQCVMSFNLGF
jgi:hypothetical protein